MTTKDTKSELESKDSKRSEKLGRIVQYSIIDKRDLPPMNVNFLLIEIRSLEKKLEIAKEALTFYADSYTWVSNSGKVGCNPIDYDWLNIPGTSGASRMCGGNKARAALTAIEEK